LVGVLGRIQGFSAAGRHAWSKTWPR
jgi:hypothetical protein